MTDTNVFQLSQPGTFADPLTEVLRDGARALLAHAVEAEVSAWLSVSLRRMTPSQLASFCRVFSEVGVVRGRTEKCPQIQLWTRTRVGGGVIVRGRRR